MAFSIIAAVAISAFFYVLSKAFEASPNVDQVGAKNFLAPRVEEGSAVPLMYGTVLNEAPNAVETVGFRAFSVKRDDRIVAYTYGLTMRLVFGATVGFPRLLGVRFNNRVVWSGEADSTTDPIVINDPDFFGGELKGGGVGDIGRDDQVDASVIFYPGFINQGQDPALQAQYELNNLQGVFPNETQVPFYRNFISIVFGNYYWGESGRMPSISAEFRCIPDNIPGYNQPINGLNGDANPIEIIYDLMTDEFYGLGYDTSRIDSTSFAAAAVTLQTEGNGASLIIDSPAQIRSVIDNLMRQIDGILFEDPSDGTFKIKLIRDDFGDPLSLPLLDENNISQVQNFSITTPDQTFNQVNLTYTDREARFNERTVFVQNGENILSSSETQTRWRDVNFLSVSNSDLAIRLAGRELKTLTLTLARARVKMNRDAFEFLPGDAVRFSWADYDNLLLIMRVVNISYGTLEDNSIVVDLIQDRFAFGSDLSKIPPSEPPNLPVAGDITVSRIIETPYFWNQRLFEADSPLQPRLMYLASEPSAGTQEDFRTLFSTDDQTFEVDKNRIAFSRRALVSTEYPYSTAEYDTVTGLVIKNFPGTLSDIPISATGLGIRQSGVNMLLVGQAGQEEIMFYEGREDAGGGTIRLTNVWRGGLDTAPVTHPVDTPVWFAVGPGVTAISLKTSTLSTIYSKLLAQNQWDVRDGGSVESIATTMVNRATKPHPADDMNVNATKVPGDVIVDTGTVTWKRRQWNLDTVYRGDDADDAQASENLLENLRFDVDARIVGDESWINPNPVWLSIDDDLPNDGGGHLVRWSDAIGHGDAECRVESKHTFIGSFDFTSYQSPVIPFHAHRFRQLLRNGDFTDSLSGWTVSFGNPLVQAGGFGDGNLSVGGPGSTSAGTPPRWEIQQRVRIADWNPEGLKGFLRYYVKRGVDVSTVDDFQVRLQALDSNQAFIAEADTGLLFGDPTDWTAGELDYVIPANTEWLNVIITSFARGELDSDPAHIFSAIDLRVGQVGSANDLLLTNNGNFNANITGWSQESGAWESLAGSNIEGGASLHLASTAAGTYRINQDFALDAGYREQATAFLQGYVARTSFDSDTVELRLEALNDANVVLQIRSTGALTPDDTFDRQELFLDLPANTTKVRVEVVVVGADATVTSPVIDTLRLFVVKELHPTSGQVSFTFESSQQSFSLIASTWQTLVGVTPSRIYPFDDDGQSVFGLDAFFRNALDSTASTRLDFLAGTLPQQQFVGWYNGTNFTSKSCFETVAGQSHGGEFVDLNDLDMGGSESFVLLVPYRCFQNPSTRSLAGSLDSTGTPQGWEVRQLASGRMELFVGSNTATTATVGQDGDHNVGANGWFAVKYNATTGQFQLITFLGEPSAAPIPAGVVQNLQPVRIGCSPSTTSGDAQFPGAVLWTGTASEPITKTNIDAWFTHAQAPSNVTYVAGGNIIGPVDFDTNGEVAAVYQSNQYAAFRTPAMRAASNRFGVSIHQSLIPLGAKGDTDPSNSAGTWQGAQGTATATVRNGPDALRMNRSVEITSDNAAANYYGSPLYSDPGNIDLKCVFWAKASAATTMRVSLLTNVGAVVETEDIAIDTQWRWYETSFTLWNSQTATLRFGFHGSNTGTPGTIELSGPVSVFTGIDATDNAPRVTREPGGTLQRATATLTNTQPEAFNSEGEVQVQGICDNDADLGTIRTIIDVSNGTNSNDRRNLNINAGDTLNMGHYDGSGTQASGSGGVAANIDWADEWTVRGRWNRAGVLEDNVTTITYAGIIAPDGVAAQVRAADWTPSDVQIDDIELSNFSLTTPLKGFVQEVTLSSRELPK